MPSERKAAHAATEANSKIIAPPKVPKEDKPAAAKRAPRAPATHPPYAEMISEAIEAEGDKRTGASRPAIKKYIVKTFGIVESNAFDSNIAAAIRRGYENGAFDLPKGLGGKIKIGSGENSDESEDEKPARSRSRKTALGTKRSAASGRTRSTTTSRKPAVKKSAAAAPRRATPAKKAAPVKTAPKKPVARTTNASKRAAAPTQVDRKPVVPKRGSVGSRKSASRSSAAKKTTTARRRSSRA